MGTNYYAVKSSPSLQQPIHIGKSSAGWIFHFQAHNDTWIEEDLILNTKQQVFNWLDKHINQLKDYILLDEYEEKVSVGKLKFLVESKQKDPVSLENEEEFRETCPLPDGIYYDPEGYKFDRSDFS